MAQSTFALPAAILEIILVLAGLFLLVRRFRKEDNAGRKEIAAWSCSPFHIALLVWLVLVGGLLFQLVALGAFSWLNPGNDERQILANAGFQLGMLGACLGFAHYTEAGKGYPRPSFPCAKEGFLAFLAVLPCVFAVGLAWTGLMQVFGIHLEKQDIVALLLKQGAGPWLAVMIVLAVVVAPATEELIFRAGLYRYLRTRTPRWVALLLPALLFAAMHTNVATFAQLTALGVLFSLAYERSGNIAVPIIAHSLFNLNTVLMLLAGIDT